METVNQEPASAPSKGGSEQRGHGGREQRPVDVDVRDTRRI
jgi:hypothetical protein